MDFDPWSLFFNVVISSLGMWYWYNGKQDENRLQVGTGAILVFVPYVICDWFLLVVIAGTLIALPYVARWYLRPPE